MGTCGAVYFEANGVYVRPQSPNTSEPVYFAGMDPRDPGFPPPEAEAEVGNPRVQWESAHYNLYGRGAAVKVRLESSLKPLRPLRGRKRAF